MLVEVCNISEKELLFAIIRGLNYKLSPNFRQYSFQFRCRNPLLISTLPILIKHLISFFETNQTFD